ncbi:helix-turn-helix transcriptional regulator [Cellulomonas fengjieae]|uniref:Helix-turn-helix domain-containing protein n=1 Tax=Cellulomonas fengjieae TaxID=2819978 RepID=A0ABS3SFY2_9CELL|nr:LuxR family transcriptional regulator [Cellulomonas fengjieae]MBO3084655.1 helix-turn-helix domain-containing protein [Cellulomonas fengjieae]QVI67021.1 helix-turn-helix domain-containing protein [Cellulomonas fengjieae]
MLVGRERERQVIGRLVAASRVGESGTLVLAGEAGIGKSALLEDAAAAVTDAGMRVLRAAGIDAEREVPFGGLLQLLRPVLDHLGAIPAPQAEALGSALALVPGSGGERFAVGAAVLSLLSRVAEDGPLAVLVDDAHLFDPPSAQALCFAARRLTADPVVVLLTVRDEAPSVVGSAGLPSLLLGGLADADAAELAGSLGHRLSTDARSRLLASTGGNPLALLELTDEGFDALPPGAPVPVPASLARTFARRADVLSVAARTALLLAAAAGGDLDATTGACALLGVSVADLDEAAREQLLTVDGGRITFRHDLVRSGIYAEAAPAERRAVHAALAQAVPADDVDRRAWHLGEATATPDAAVADVLDDAARRARARGAWAVAAAGFERSARLTPDAADRVQRLVAAAESAWRAGLPDAARDLLARASVLPQPPELRTRADALDGAVAARTGSVERARDVFLAAGTRAAPDDPDTAVALLAAGIEACQFAGDVPTAQTAAALLARLEPRSPRARFVGAVAIAVADILAGHGGPDILRTAMADVDAFLDDPQLAPWLVIGPLFLRESAAGREVIPTVVAHSRRRSDIGGLPILLFYVARDQATTDRWDDAVAGYTEGVQLAREAGQATDVTACLAGLSWLEARRGDLEACREHAEEALALSVEHHLGFFEVWALTALAERELALGRTDAALERFRALDEVLTQRGMRDVDLSPAAEMVEAMVHLGRSAEAGALAAALTERAEVKGQPWSMARAARAAGLTCPDADVDVCFSVALAYHQHTPDAFETGRTELAYGSRLRRLKRRSDARPHLRSALAAFDRLGAVPWADQAAAELRATGETAQRRSATGLDRLTPQELQVALMLASGRTTREAAAALFLSPKTIEYHLRNVYLKLGIRSRSELADAIPA